MMQKALILGLVALSLGSCMKRGAKAELNLGSKQHFDYFNDATQWYKARKLEVNFSDYAVHPMAVTLQRDYPFELVIINEGQESHHLSLKEFLLACDIKGLKTPDGSIINPSFEMVEIYPGREISILLIPRLSGIYTLSCVTPRHNEKEVVATIR